MITCWHCTTKLLDGTIFCDHCGAALLDGAPRRTMPPLPVSDNTATLSLHGTVQVPVPPCADSRRTTPRLILAESGTAIPLPCTRTLVVGRHGERGPSPDIDLAPFHAADAGVSRAHAALDLAGPRPLIKDLGSTNGTYINGSRLPPHTPAPVYSGDLINLGQLSVRLEL